jgi:hypothetical protein
MEDLPFIDEHSTKVDATRERVWEALVSVLRTDLGGGAAAPLTRLLRVEPSSRQGDWRGPPSTGDTIPGFAVAETRAPERLALRGEHRFAHYALIFELDERDGETCTLRAQTWAEFPGLAGRLYRALVIGTRGHRLVVHRLLRHTARRASSTSSIDGAMPWTSS